MGIRFRCHHCEHELNLKEFQAGRRARCPACSGRFRVPTASADFSMPLDEQESQMAAAATSGNQHSVGGTFNLRPSSSDPDIGGGRSAAAQRLPSAPSADLPRAIGEAPQAVWYVRPPSGGQYGPAEGHHFIQWLNDNRISPDSLVWRDGWPQWQLAGDVFVEFFGDGWRLGQSDSQSNAGSDEISLVEEASAVSTTDELLSDAEATFGSVSPLAGQTPSVPASEPATVSSVALTRKKKKQATYGIFIGILAVLALVLVGVLIAVVF